MSTEIKYNGFFNQANEPETDEHITIFVSDWLKNYWAAYVSIDADSYEDDIDQIQEFISKMNWRDQDVYIECVNESGLNGFYQLALSKGWLDDHEVLNKELWEILEDEPDQVKIYAASQIGPCGPVSEVKEWLEEIQIAESYEDLFELEHPEEMKYLMDHNLFNDFNCETFFNGHPVHEVRINIPGQPYERWIISEPY
jgi:hypothetical protein